MRLLTCNFFLQFQEDWFERVIWTDEKMFVLIQEPHRQNDRTWAPVSPQKVAKCKKACGEKCMAWTGIVDGRCLPVVWFQGSVNGEVYLDLLQNTMWPSVRGQATRKQYWFIQDGAPSHVQAMHFSPPAFLHCATFWGDTGAQVRSFWRWGSWMRTNIFSSVHITLSNQSSWN